MDITDKYLNMLESKVTELSMRNLELQRRINETIEIVKSFEYYIPEDNKQELIEILRGIDEK